MVGVRKNIRQDLAKWLANKVTSAELDVFWHHYDTCRTCRIRVPCVWPIALRR